MPSLMQPPVDWVPKNRYNGAQGVTYTCTQSRRLCTRHIVSTSLPFLMVILHALVTGGQLPHDNGQRAFLHAQARSHKQLHVLVANATQRRHLLQKAYQILNFSHPSRANLNVSMPITTTRKGKKGTNSAQTPPHNYIWDLYTCLECSDSALHIGKS